MKKIFIISILLVSFSGISQNRYRIKTGGGKITGAQIVDSLDVELGGVTWRNGVPNGGTTGQVLAKASGTDGDVQWVNQTGGSDDQTASEVPITDAGNNYTGTNVEAALAEVADSLAAKVNINPNSLPIELFRGNYAAAQAEYGVDPNTWPEKLFGLIPDYPETPIPLSSITYDNSTSGMTAENGKDAIDELDARVDINDAKVSNATHTGDVTGSTTLTIATGAVGSDELASTAVTPGSYTNADITVDADGRVTAASNGSVGTDDQTASEVTVAATPVNYTPDDSSVEGHLGGIDDALASVGGGIIQEATLTLTDVDFTGDANVDNTIIAAQGSGTIIEPVQVLVYADNITSTVSTTTWQINYVGDGGALANNTAVGAGTGITSISSDATGFYRGSVDPDNAGLNFRLSHSNAEATTGSFRVKILYRVWIF